MSLKEKLSNKGNGGGIAFMDGANKGDMSEIIGRNVTITDFDFIKGENGEYVVFTVKEVENTFFFGGKVLTEDLSGLSLSDRAELRENGLPVLFEEKKNKAGRKYTGVTYYPENVPF